MDPINAALTALSLQSKPNYTQTAKEYGVKRSTLSHRYRNITGSKADGYNAQSFLTKEQSKTLITFINKLTDYRLPPTVAIVQNFAQEITGKTLGSH